MENQTLQGKELPAPSKKKKKKIRSKKVNRSNERQLPVKFIPTVIYFCINNLSTEGNKGKPTSHFSLQDLYEQKF